MSKIGISQKAIIFNKKGKILALHRTSTAPSNPDKWDFPGGELDFGEDTNEGIIREIEEETRLKVDKIHPFDVESHINKQDEFWVTIAYRAEVGTSNIELSFEHDKYQWVTKGEFLSFETSGKLKRFVENLDK